MDLSKQKHDSTRDNLQALNKEHNKHKEEQRRHKALYSYLLFDTITLISKKDSIRIATPTTYERIILEKVLVILKEAKAMDGLNFFYHPSANFPFEGLCLLIKDMYPVEYIAVLYKLAIYIHLTEKRFVHLGVFYYDNRPKFLEDRVRLIENYLSSPLFEEKKKINKG